ncbi:MAG: response regulator transcription factor, partial [Methyloprofundus sp.]|nr:response regulator transcription factor [Methyloprofundus sp.]
MTDINVILVEDDDGLRESLAEVLELSGFHVDAVNCAMAFYQTLNLISYDVALVDIGLPDQSGLEIVEFLREKTRLGIILLTAKSTVADRVLGYESGADHYFVKPVDSFELMAVIRNLYGRRVEQLPSVSEMTHWCLERSTWKLICPEGSDIKLTAKEMKLLNRLMQQPGECVMRSQLLNE